MKLEIKELSYLKGIFIGYFRLEGSIVHVNFAEFINTVNIIFMALSASWLSGLLFYMQGYLYVLFISILVSLHCLHWFLYSHLLITMELWGWHLDTLAWLMAFFVLTIGLIIQRFSVRYLMGITHIENTLHFYIYYRCIFGCMVK